MKDMLIALVAAAVIAMVFVAGAATAYTIMVQQQPQQCHSPNCPIK
jgi:hypothetical protein